MRYFDFAQQYSTNISDHDSVDVKWKPEWRQHNVVYAL